MKYICKGAVKKNCLLVMDCFHSEPHEWRNDSKIGESYHSSCFNPEELSEECDDCDCIPLPLDFLMKEIIKEEGK